MGRILGVFLCLGWLACYQPPHPNCGFVCGTSGACPADYTCAADNICHYKDAPAGTACYADAALGPDSPDADLTAPVVTFTTPVNGATGVSRTADIVATFDQPVANVSNASFIVSATSSLLGTVSYNPGQQTANFTPSPPLPAATLITVMLTTDIHNSLGVPFGGYTFTFTTLDDQPPTLVSSVPLDMATGVPISSTIAVTFSEPVTGVTTSSFTVAQGITPITGMVTGTAADYTFTPTIALPPASVITVSLSATIQDLAGNALVPVQFTFTTQ